MKKIRTVLTMAMIVMLGLSSSMVFAERKNSKPIIAQYFGIWVATNRSQTWEQKFRADTPFKKLNRIYIAFCRLIKTKEGYFSLEFDGEVKHARAIIDRVKADNPNAEIFVSLGGSGGMNEFGGAAKDDKFAENVRNFLARYGLHGIDIDWEMGLNKSDLNLLITHLYSTLHNAGYKLTLSVWPFVTSAYDIPLLKANLDQMNIMSYGRGRSLANIVDQFVKAGFPIEKLIGGIETEVPYHEAGGPDTLGIDGTIIKKAKYALQHGLAGMMAWRLDNDYPYEDNLNYPTYRGSQLLWETMKSEIAK